MIIIVAQSKSTCSPVADLVHELIKLGSALISHEGDQAKVVQCEVANCLGEIGAVDLSTVSLGCRNKPGNGKNSRGNKCQFWQIFVEATLRVSESLHPIQN